MSLKKKKYIIMKTLKRKSSRRRFITLTNSGYIDYTLNCIESLKKIKATLKLHCYCIGKEGYDRLKEKKVNVTLIDDENNSNFQKFKQGNWSNITYYKFVVIHENLKKYPYVLFTDGDIVYENKDFYKYLEDNIGEHELLIQNDTQDDKSRKELCSGFMFIRSTENTLKYFNPESVEKYKDDPNWNDQLYINSIKNKLKYKLLPLDLFPNGKYFREQKPISPYIIHFNHEVGHWKKRRMEKYKKWYI